MSKIKELLTLLDAPAELVEGLEKGEKTVDDFKAFFQSNFVNKAMAVEDEEIRSKVTGRVLGGISTFMKTEGGFQKADIKDKTPEDIFKMYKANMEAKVADLTAASGQNSDEAIKTWEAKYKKVEQERDDYKGMADTNFKGWEEEKANASQKIKSFKLNNIVSGVKSKVPFKDGISEIEKAGFDFYINSNYKIDLNDNDEPEVYNTKGERVKTETGNKFVGLEDLILGEAKKNNLLKLNNAQGGQPATVQAFQQTFSPNQNGQNDRAAHLASVRKK